MSIRGFLGDGRTGVVGDIDKGEDFDSDSRLRCNKQNFRLTTPEISTFDSRLGDCWKPWLGRYQLSIPEYENLVM